MENGSSSSGDNYSDSDGDGDGDSDSDSDSNSDSEEKHYYDEDGTEIYVKRVPKSLPSNSNKNKIGTHPKGTSILEPNFPIKVNPIYNLNDDFVNTPNETSWLIENSKRKKKY
ncbi:hypothetical protein ACTA71_010932 [Dictyostelium dimigraforme]